MILKASKRGGSKQLARHLMNGETNEHVSVHEVLGFASETIEDALNEIYAISRGTRCSRFLFSLSLSPPQHEHVPVKDFEEALAKIEKKLGLVGQPRILLFHEKEGRRHAHCVWSRIDGQSMTAIDLPFFKNRLKEISKELYLHHGWKLPKGFIDKNAKNLLNFTRAEWQQAARTGQNPKAIKAALLECWASSDSRKAFEHALTQRGYYLARGNQRSFVAVDIYGEIYSLPRKLALKKKDMEKRLGKPDALPSVEQVKENISGQVTKIFKGFLDELGKDHSKKLRPLLKTKHAMTRQHRIDRAAQKTFQGKRLQEEENLRASKIRKGFKGIWDKLTGAYWKQRKANEKESWQAYSRDQKERDDLIRNQLVQRQQLQAQLNLMRGSHEKERQALIRDLSHMVNAKSGKTKETPSRVRSPSRSQTHSSDKYQGHSPDPGQDFEPEI